MTTNQSQQIRFRVGIVAGLAVSVLIVFASLCHAVGNISAYA